MTTTVVTQAKRHMCRKEEDMSSYTEGQVHQLMDRLQSNGFTSEHLTLLGQYKDPGSIKDVLEGRSEIKPREYEVDLDADPFIPFANWSVKEQKRGGQFKYDPTKVVLYLDKEQKNGKHIDGNKLHKKFANRDVFNANLLDFFLKNIHLIPESWKGQYVFFRGTIYQGNGDCFLYIRCLFWENSKWHDSFRWFDDNWRGNHSTAVRCK
jgi:hypothetical protein